ncbi:hypothetical protein AWH62_06930 [Maricaulis sp. W15]|uniref:response regulator n=1 Tax=Maricaulis sp. W15 TaxID=1772333 RepID=UPI000948CECE|nr:response regulator [Maricaulis sp. W15]OLF73885.1 hypothetical protein AWH62_06930 [Maricaulis sp. W15]
MPKSLDRILYLEDVQAIADVVVMALEDLAGFEVHHADRGAKAITAVESFQPDLCLFDVMLPDMDGPETLRRIRALAGHDDMPAIFMTAKTQTHEPDDYARMDSLGVIMKPFDPITLGDTIREMWNTRPDRS